MFAPFMLPFQITCILLFVAFAALLGRTKAATPKSLLRALITCIVLFLPTFLVVSFVDDYVRYGEFHYSAAS